MAATALVVVLVVGFAVVPILFFTDVLRPAGRDRRGHLTALSGASRMIVLDAEDPRRTDRDQVADLARRPHPGRARATGPART